MSDSDGDSGEDVVIFNGHTVVKGPKCFQDDEH